MVLSNPTLDKSFLQCIIDSFSKTYIGLYHPLTIISLKIDSLLYGTDPFGYKLSNLIFHIISVIFLFLTLKRYFNHSIVVLSTIVFALHPMHVESVAWVSERKDVLFATFYVISLYFYSQSKKKNKVLNYSLSFFAFILSLLSKSAAVTIPVVMLVFDYVSEKSFSLKQIIKKSHFFILSLAFGILTITLFDTQNNLFVYPNDYGLIHKFLIPFNGYLFYIIKFILPVNLSAAYLFPLSSEGFSFVFYSSPAIILILILIIWKSGIYKNKIILSGIIIYTVTIFLFLQILPHGRVYAANRYSYIPYIGLSIITGYFLHKYIQQKIVANTILSVISIVLFLISIQHIKIWQNGVSLFTNIIEYNPDHNLGYTNRGAAYYYGFSKNKKPDYQKCIRDCNIAISLNPIDSVSIFNRGNSFFNIGNLEKARKDYHKCILIEDNHYKAYNNLGLSYAYSNNFEKAIELYHKSIEINNSFPDSHNNLGFALFYTGDTLNACSEWNKAITGGNLQSVKFFHEFCE